MSLMSLDESMSMMSIESDFSKVSWTVGEQRAILQRTLLAASRRA
jgi:hypothetical protein